MLGSDTIHRIDQLKTAWAETQPLAKADEERLWRKLRLEWNYNSNHIEGNTLTYGETKLLLIFGQTDGSHTMREYEEMKAHDVAIQHIRQLAEASQIITEADIRALNAIVLKEPFWKPARTADGKETRKLITPGEYKSAPNNVRTATGEMFQFADPIETPFKMRELVTWLQTSLAVQDSAVANVVSKLHYDFVCIHPFDDGNGRVARLLVNYVLLRLGYPPVIIKSRDKKNYLTALNKADAGDLGAFTAYMANEIVWSLQLGLRASRGESIEEPDDLDKEVAVFTKQHQGGVKPAVLSVETLRLTAEHSWIPLIKMLGEKLSPLAKLFHSFEISVKQGLHSGVYSFKQSFKPFDWRGRCESENKEWLEIFHRLGILSDGSNLIPARFEFEFFLNGFANAPAPFSTTIALQINLEPYSYTFSSPILKLSEAKVRYDHILTKEEICGITNPLVKAVLEKIKQSAGD